MSDHQRVVELDGLRGLAVLMVVIHHYFSGIVAGPFATTFVTAQRVFAPFFLSGVDLFFVLSGYIVGGMVIDGIGKAGFIRAFYIRRATRILPLYFLVYGAFLLANAVNAVQPNPMGIWLLKDNMPLWSYAVFMQNYFMALVDHAGGKFFAMSWSVATEEHFYVLFPLALLLLGRKGALGICVAIVVVCPFVRIWASDHFDSFFAAYAPFPSRADSIGWGVLLAATSRRWPQLVGALGTRLILLAVLGVSAAIVCLQGLGEINIGYFRFSAIAIFYTCVVYFAVLKVPVLSSSLRWRPLVFLGFISYALYMVHQFVNGMVQGFVLGREPIIASWGDVALTMVSLSIAVALAYTSTRFFEMPIRRLGYRWTQQSAPALVLRTPGMPAYDRPNFI